MDTIRKFNNLAANITYEYINFKRLKFYTFLIIILSFSANAQEKLYTGLPSLVWPKLYNIKFEKVKDSLGEFEKAVFSDQAKSLDGKQVSLPGYMVPFESGIRGKHFMLSSLPLNACFFCGVGGPETVVEVFMKEAVAFTEHPIEIQGVLKLNDKDPGKMIYILENAELLGKAEF